MIAISRIAPILIAVPFFAIPATAQQLAPRAKMPQSEVRALPFPDEGLPGASQGYRLNVKFVDEARVRADSGALRSLHDRDLVDVRAIAGEYGLSFRAALPWPEARAAAFESRVAAKTGLAQPDLLGIHYVELQTADPAVMERAGAALQLLPVVEFAYIEMLGVAPPGDIAPVTPNLFANQGYHGPDPGLDVDYATSQGKTGSGIRISDCEYNWTTTHEDLVDVGIIPEPGQTPHPNTVGLGWDDHGTAVLGETSAAVNGYGCSGIAPDASVYTFPEWTLEGGFRRLAAVTNAIDGSSPGDVVLLEMQTGGAGGGVGPAELDPAIWLVCKMGVDDGVVVVGAAGNGNQDLDSLPYAAYMAGGDSGAILVGAGTPDAFHDKVGLSTYGSRVNVQGWGLSVFTLGYGTSAQFGGDKNQEYTAFFNGTSSASPFVAASCAILQQTANDVLGQPIAPELLRQHLIDTGIPQGLGGNIGPFPDLKLAVDGVGTLFPTIWTDLGNGLASPLGTPALRGTGSLAPGQSWELALVDGTPNATALLVIGVNQVNLPFFGGILVPSPDALFFTKIFVDGSWKFSGFVPDSFLPDIVAYFQIWIHHAFGPQGISASNGLRGAAP